MVLFECCNIFAYFSQKSSAKVQKIFEIHKCFSNYFGDKSTHTFFTIKAKSWSVLTDSQSVPDGPRVRSRRKNHKKEHKKQKAWNKLFVFLSKL